MPSAKASSKLKTSQLLIFITKITSSWHPRGSKRGRANRNLTVQSKIISRSFAMQIYYQYKN